MRPQRRHGLTLLTACLVWFSWSCHREPRILSEKEFAPLYARLAMAGISVRDSGGVTSQAHRKAEEILRQAGASREEVDATVRWYNQDVTRWKGFYEHVIRAMEDSLGK